MFDYGNSIRGEAQLAGYDRAFDFPGFVPAYIRPLFCEGKGPFRWAALSGDPADIAATDRAVRDLFPDNEPLARWIELAGQKVHFQGLPARICWLGYGERHLAGLRFNEMVARGDISAPIVLGRDHLDCGSVASPYRETEAMADGSDAIADWPILNALVNTASGASWVSVHHGGGVGIGRSIHAGQVCVADGTPLAGAKLERVLTNDPATGVIRHVDAGYGRAAEVAAARGVQVPMGQVPMGQVPVGQVPWARSDGPGPDGPGHPVSFRALWEALLPIGRDPGTGGYRRFSWTPADLSCRDWFAAAAAARGLAAEQDRVGNLWAWWDTASETGKVGNDGLDGAASRDGAVVAGSHLDSVPDGGAFDGPLGVVSAFAAIDALRERGFKPARPVAVVAFTEEEGARFGVACLGSRLLTGAITAAAARGLRDADGVSLAEAMAAAGADPDLLGPDDELPDRVAAFVELHIEQGRQLVDLDAVIGVGSGIWPHGQVALRLRGAGRPRGHDGAARSPRPDAAFRRDRARGQAGRWAPPRARYVRQGECVARWSERDPVCACAHGLMPARPTKAACAAWSMGSLRRRTGWRPITASRSSRCPNRSHRRSSSTPLCVPGCPVRWRAVASRRRCCGQVPGTTPGCSPPGYPPRCCSSATPPVCRTLRRSTLTWPDCETGVAALAAVLEELAATMSGDTGNRGRKRASVLACRTRLAARPRRASRRADRSQLASGSVRSPRRSPGGDAPAEAVRLPGLTLPGFANAHSHAFHRALRGITQAGHSTFWTWRERMYEVAARLDPGSYLALARAVYAEMALAGVSCVGEFHYLHHGAGGRPYRDPNAMGRALIQAAADAGIRITLLDTCYLSGGLSPRGRAEPLAGAAATVRRRGRASLGGQGGGARA